MSIRLFASVATAAALIAGAAASSAPAPAKKPMRVMTMMLCSDQLAMMLLPPERISSITYVSLAGTSSPELDAVARRLKINHGLAEEVLAQKPDLIVAGDFTTPTTRRLAKQMGIPVVELPPAESFDDVRDQFRLLGRVFGEEARAQAWIARMDATLAELARTAPKRPIVAVGWNGGGRVSGRRSMFNAILEAAGGRNVAAGEDIFERSVDLEQLLAMRPRPDILLNGVSARVKVGTSVNQVQHPLLKAAFGARRLSYPEGPYTCGTPYAADAAAALRKAMLKAMAEAGR